MEGPDDHAVRTAERPDSLRPGGTRLRDDASAGLPKGHPPGPSSSQVRLPDHLVDRHPGAYPGATAEEDGIASAIASAIREWFHIRTPVIAAIVGEGGSGGALGMAVADRVIMLENSIYSVAAPEAAASIVWRDSSRKKEAAE